MIRGEAGLNCYYAFNCCTSCYAPYIGLSWVGEFPLHKSKQKVTFSGQTVEVISYNTSVRLASPQAGIKWTHCCGASVILGYKGLFNSSVRINQAEARLEWVFYPPPKYC